MSRLLFALVDGIWLGHLVAARRVAGVQARFGTEARRSYWAVVFEETEACLGWWRSLWGAL